MAVLREGFCFLDRAIVRERTVQSTVAPYADVDIPYSFAFEFDRDLSVAENELANRRHMTSLRICLDHLVEVLAVHVSHCVA